MDGWICSGCAITEDSTVQRRAFVPTLSVLFVTVSGGESFADKLAAVSATRDLGCLAGGATCADQREFSDSFGVRYHGADDSVVEQPGSVDPELGAELAGLVFGGDGISTTRGGVWEDAWRVILVSG